MVTFKQFLNEASVDEKPEFKPNTVEEAIATLNEHCKDALWMLQENTPIYRGEKSVPQEALKTGFMTVDTSATERKSQNTKNYYTVILDNNPLMKDYPKRSRSFICSTRLSYASGFAGGQSGAALIVVPFDGVKIGMCGSYDMWETHVQLLGRNEDIADMNDMFEDLGIVPALKSFTDFNDRLKAGDQSAIKDLRRVFRSKDYDGDFLSDVWKAYSPSKLKFSLHTTKDFPHITDEREVWIGGKVMMITREVWDKMRKKL